MTTSKLAWAVTIGWTLTALVVAGADVVEPDGHAQKPSDNGLELVLLPVRPSFDEVTFGGDLKRMRTTSVFRTAASFGFRYPDDFRDYFIARRRTDSVFYLFHNTVRCPKANRYLVQRIRKTIDDVSANDTPVSRTDVYMVEAFKTQGGQLKRPDQHFGAFHLNGFKRRTITKTFEIGIIKPDADDEFPPWPYDPSLLATSIQPYSSDREAYDAVEYSQSLTWTLRVELVGDGSVTVESPELGIGYRHQQPVAPDGLKNLMTHPESVTLTSGLGMPSAHLGISVAELREGLGDPIRIVPRSSNELWIYPGGITCEILNDRLIGIRADADFKGRTAAGLRMADPSARLKTIYPNAKANPGGFEVPGLHVRMVDDRVVAWVLRIAD